MGQKLKLDFTGVESFQRASEGVHAVKIATAEVKQSQGGNDMIVVAFEVTKGADKGARVYDNFVLTDSALWKLKGLLQAIGMKADGKVQLDTDKLVGKVCQINVQHEEYDGKLRARCESIMKFVPETSDDEDDEDIDDAQDEFEDDVAEETPAKAEKKSKKEEKKPSKKDPEPEDDDDWDDDDDEADLDEESEEKKPKKPVKEDKKKATKEEKPAKKSKKEEPEDEDDDWDDDDDWDEE